MIEEINIKNLGIISEATLTLGPGLSVLTGETGAGKTMIITALGLLLGARAENATIKENTQQANITGSLLLNPNNQAIQIAHNAGAEPDTTNNKTELILNRTININGRNKAHTCGTTIPATTLSKMASHLIAIHGQSDQIRLKEPKQQQAALDKFGHKKLAEQKKSYTKNYQHWTTEEKKLASLKENTQHLQHEIAYLKNALQDISNHAPQNNENTELQEKAKKLRSIETLKTSTTAAHNKLSTETFNNEIDTISLLAEAERHIQEAAQNDITLLQISQRIAEASYTIADIATEISDYKNSLELDTTNELAQTEQRIADLSALIRKYSQDLNQANLEHNIDGILKWEKQIAQRLNQIDSDPQVLENKIKKQQDLLQTLQQQAIKISETRKEISKIFSQNVTKELTKLAMSDAKFSIQISQKKELSSEGIDEIEFLIQPHAGSTPRPISKGASGGELSRIMLAIEVVLAEVGTIPTFIFDEIDSGVGGRAATEIGKRLAILAKQSQVIVVTHLPQVAAYAQNHLKISKHSDTLQQVTTSDIKTLNSEEKVIELARMLSGEEDSRIAKSHAIELLEKAKKFSHNIA